MRVGGVGKMKIVCGDVRGNGVGGVIAGVDEDGSLLLEAIRKIQ